MINRVTVSIADKEYTLVAGEDAAYVRRCADFVDEHVREVLAGGKLSLVDAAVLAAVNVADRCLKEQESAENLRRQIQDILEANKKLESELSECKREIFKLQNRR